MTNADNDPIDALTPDALTARTRTLVYAALADHPQRERAAEIIDSGGSVFARRVDSGRLEFYVGWFADPRLRPAGADPSETVPVMKVPLSALQRGLDGPGGGE